MCVTQACVYPFLFDSRSKMFNMHAQKVPIGLNGNIVR
jgi:hypothetical protein